MGYRHVFVLAFLLLPIVRADAQPQCNSPQHAAELVRNAVYLQRAEEAHHGRWMYTVRNIQNGVVTVEARIEITQGTLALKFMRDGKRIYKGPFLESTRAHMDSDAKDADEFLALLPDAVRFECDDGDGDVQTIAFMPKVHRAPTSWRGRVVAAMKGTIVLDERTGRIISMRGHLTRDVTYGYGFFGRVARGGFASVRWGPLPDGTWKLQSFSVDAHGTVLLLKNIVEDRDETRYDFRPVPSDIGRIAAATLLERYVAAQGS